MTCPFSFRRQEARCRGKRSLYRGVEVAAAASGNLAVEQGDHHAVQKPRQAGDKALRIDQEAAAVAAGGRVPRQGRAGAVASAEAQLADRAGLGGAADAAAVAGFAPARFGRRVGVDGDQLFHVAGNARYLRPRILVIPVKKSAVAVRLSHAGNRGLSPID